MNNGVRQIFVKNESVIAGFLLIANKDSCCVTNAIVSPFVMRV